MSLLRRASSLLLPFFAIALLGCGSAGQSKGPVYGEGAGVWFSPSGGELCPMFSKKADCERLTKKHCIRRTTTEHGGWPDCSG